MCVLPARGTHNADRRRAYAAVLSMVWYLRRRRRRGRGVCSCGQGSGAVSDTAAVPPSRASVMPAAACLSVCAGSTLSPHPLPPTHDAPRASPQQPSGPNLSPSRRRRRASASAYSRSGCTFLQLGCHCNCALPCAASRAAMRRPPHVHMPQCAHRTCAERVQGIHLRGMHSNACSPAAWVVR
jgi:hypothetical protein